MEAGDIFAEIVFLRIDGSNGLCYNLVESQNVPYD